VTDMQVAIRLGWEPSYNPAIILVRFDIFRNDSADEIQRTWHARLHVVSDTILRVWLPIHVLIPVNANKDSTIFVPRNRGG